MRRDDPPGACPLGVRDGVAVVVGIVVGAGIFKTPALVAATTGSGAAIVLAWTLGGLVSLVGALCYAELASAYPDRGGDYHYLRRAFGHGPAFLFAWARFAVIQTGSVAMMAFLAGDFVADALRLGPRASALSAAAAVVTLTAVNAAGIHPGRLAQNVLSAAVVGGLALVAAAGLLAGGAPPDAGAAAPTPSAPGAAMIFVLLTYGGWSEAAYLATELRQTTARPPIVRVLVAGVALVTVLYLAVNLALVRGLGVDAMARSTAVTNDLVRAVAGEPAADVLGLLVVAAALGTMNGTMLTGGRSAYAMGRDAPGLGWLGRWRETRGTPTNAVLAQGAIALALVLAGSVTRGGFVAMVEYTAPVFWLFLLLVGLALFVLRVREPGRRRPFAVPCYPTAPLLFCAACAYMLHASLVHTGRGALAGLAVLLGGLPLLGLGPRRGG
jgi:amino acid transporter